MPIYQWNRHTVLNSDFGGSDPLGRVRDRRRRFGAGRFGTAWISVYLYIVLPRIK